MPTTASCASGCPATTAACAASSTSTSAARTSASSTGWTRPSRTATSSRSCPRSPAAHSEVVRAHEVALERRAEHGGERLHALRHRALVGGDDLVAPLGLAAVQLLHLLAGEGGLEPGHAVRAAQGDRHGVVVLHLAAHRLQVR